MQRKCVIVRFAGILFFSFCMVLCSCDHKAIYIERSSAMAPTIPPETTIAVDHQAYDKNAPDRWDVIAFRYPMQTNWVFAMRVVGLPGESILMNTDGIIIDNIPLTIPDFLKYLPFSANLEQKYAYRVKFDIPPKHVFVLGDNSDVANDSRFWGPLNLSHIIGKVTGAGGRDLARAEGSTPPHSSIESGGTDESEEEPAAGTE